MKHRVPDHEVDQRGSGERSWERTVEHLNTTRMLWIVVDEVDKG